MSRQPDVTRALTWSRARGVRAARAAVRGALAVPVVRREVEASLGRRATAEGSVEPAADGTSVGDPVHGSPEVGPSAAERMAVAVQEVAWMQNQDPGHPLRAPVVDAFHRMYYDEALLRGGTWHQLAWRGTRVWKLPFDLWQYQELIHELRPDLIVECGTAFGGSALFMADVCEAVGSGQVLTIDVVAQPDLPQHQRIRYVTGSSTDERVLATVRDAAASARTVMVILDSDHSRDHVLAECRAYADVVTDGSYLVVEDSNVNGHPVLPEHGPGPMEALQTFLEEDPRFRHDQARDKLLISFNPEGWLQKGTGS